MNATQTKTACKWFVRPVRYPNPRFNGFVAVAKRGNQEQRVGPTHPSVEACRRYIQREWDNGRTWPCSLTGELESTQTIRRGYLGGTAA
jgi:hypothetical protein